VSVSSSFTPVMFRLLDHEKHEIIPPSHEHKTQRIAFRVSDDVTCAFFDAPPNTLLEFFRNYDGLTAVGAKQIWELFPISHNYFVAEIDRAQNGYSSRIFTELSECIYGDQLARRSLYFPMERGFGPLNHFDSSADSSVDSESIDLGIFQFLISPSPGPLNVSEQKYEVFCLSNFSTDMPPEALNELDLSLVSASQLDDLRKFVSFTLQEQNPAFARHTAFDIQRIIPPETSFALLFRESSFDQHDFDLAIVSRILSAATLRGAVWGRIQTSWRAENDSNFSFESFGDQHNSRAYASREIDKRLHVSGSDEIVKNCFELVKQSNMAKFASGKEDCSSSGILRQKAA
jgi:hypothetical protein